MQAKGYTAAIVVNNKPGDPIAMGGSGTGDDPTIVAIMVSRSDADAVRALNGEQATIGNELTYAKTRNQNVLASFR